MSETSAGEVRPVAPGTAAQPGDPGTAGSTGPTCDPDHPASFAELLQRIARSNVLVVVLAFVFAFLIGSLLILVASTEVRAALGYFFARPSDTALACFQVISDAYKAMFRGAIYDANGFSRTAGEIRERGGSGLYVLLPSLAAGFTPLLETLTVATPLIIAAVGMAVSFRSGLFNIGGTGQLIVGATAAGFVGFSIDLPPVIHLLACIVAAILGGGLYGAIAGFLKARFGASEVISTIMLNWVATYALAFALTTAAFTGANQAQPTSPSIGANARLPLIAGEDHRLHLGLLLAILAAVFLWWLMNRSTVGFRFRAVGSNPRAAEVAGIDVGRSAVGVMFVAGALVGLAGGVHVLGTEQRLTGGIAGTIGFDAITVALLGRSGPVGILLAGLLFAALSTGGRFMESSQGTPIDLVQVIQALVVLFIAAPPLVRSLVGLRGVDHPRSPRRRRDAAPVAAAAVSPAPGSSAADDAGVPAGTSAAPDAAGTAAAEPDRPADSAPSAADPAGGPPSADDPAGSSNGENA